MIKANILKPSNITKSPKSKAIFLLFFALFSLWLFLPTPAKAASFEAGRIIDDSIFVNKNSMSVADIQNFLNSKVPTCNRWHAGFTGSSGTVYSPPWTCLKEYNENPTTKQNNIGQFNPNGSPVVVPGGLSAAQIIWNAAQTYSINPQVILVTLQKETGLITDDWAASWQYRTAMGFGCPDGAPCDAQWFGFANQVAQGTRHFRSFFDGVRSGGFWTPRLPGVNTISYNPNSACGGSSVNITTRAAAALYSYTPYQPNAAALNNLYGTGDACSAYGNRNFWRDFTGWFGSTTSTYNNIALINKGPNLASGSRLVVGDYLLSPGGNNVLTLQADGNLVLYRSGAAVWASGTAGRPAVYAEMQADGNLVVYSDYTATWSSSTVGNINATLKMQADGNLVIYSSSGSALWNTRTDLTQAQKNQVYSKLPTGTLYAEQKLESPNKKYKMVLQTDGNLVVYSPTKAIWNSRTWGTAVKRLDMQPDGNLVLYDQNKKPLWHTSTWGKGASRLVMQDDGNLVVYSASGAPTWHTNTVGQ